MPRINYTGRKKIKYHDITITIFDRKGILSFEADIDLSDYKLPLDSPVYVEAYRQTAWMRFEYGTVIHVSPKTDNRLTEFDSLDGIRFRVKVSQNDGTHGKLLAIADKIRPVKPEEGDADRQCILPVQSHDMECIWKVDYEGDEPILLINRKAGSKDIVAKSQEFVSLVYPSVLREVLYKIRDDNSEWQDDEESWQNKWLKFTTLLPGVGDTPDWLDDETHTFNQWVDDAVEAFSRQLNVVNKFVSYHSEGEN
jgi:hypothetical protein